MFASHATVLSAAILLLISHQSTVMEQDATLAPSAATESESGIDSADPRVVALKADYDQRLNALNGELIKSIEQLGKTKAPAYLELVDKVRNGRITAVPFGFASHFVHVNATDIAETQAWDHCIDNPPLHPRAVLSIADETMRARFHDEDTTFILQRISLVPLHPEEGKWYWEATYELSKGKNAAEFTIAIRMDGKILTSFLFN